MKIKKRIKSKNKNDVFEKTINEINIIRIFRSLSFYFYKIRTCNLDKKQRKYEILNPKFETKNWPRLTTSMFNVGHLMFDVLPPLP